jgi:hypothetical protein
LAILAKTKLKPGWLIPHASWLKYQLQLLLELDVRQIQINRVESTILAKLFQNLEQP